MSVSLDTLTWSKSHVATSRECTRKTHFSYVPSDNAEIKRLKKLTNRYMWSAGQLHRIVGDTLKLVSQQAPLPTLDALLNQTRDELRRMYKSSLDAADSPDRFFEHEYNVAVPKEAWAAQWAQVEKGLTWFMSSPWLKRFQECSPEHWKTIDDVLSFEINGTKSYVKIDCALEMDGKFILIDWKTSAPKESDVFNMTVAALYAVDVWGAEPSQIEGNIVSLIDGTRKKVMIDEDVLIETSGILGEQVEHLMNVHSSFGDDPYQLPQAPLQTCERCNFKKLCLTV